MKYISFNQVTGEKIERNQEEHDQHMVLQRLNNAKDRAYTEEQNAQWEQNIRDMAETGLSQSAIEWLRSFD